HAIAVLTAPYLVAYARARPGALNFASLGIGSASHLAGEVFTRAVGIEAVHVPYRNLSDSFIEMLLGRLHYAVYTLPSVLAAGSHGRVRPPPRMAPQRRPTLPP